jgi:hypothetical protein
MGRFFTVSMLLLTLLISGCLDGRTPEQPPGRPPAVQEEAPRTSLPAPDETEAEEAKPAEEPSPPEIGYTEAVRQITRLYPDGLQPLTVRGRIPIILHDLDKDQHPECFSLGIPSQGIDAKEAAQLGDSSRLFQEESTPVAFALLVFANDHSNFRRRKVLDLGERYVFEHLRRTTLYSNRPLPVIITVSFQTVEGRDVELLVFDNASGLPRARRSLAETLSTQFQLEDIDKDGMIDLFVKEKAIEEGTGFETFLTWYRWNGRDFVEYQTQNIVRNLNTFLASAAELLLIGDLKDTVSTIVDPSTVRDLRRKGWGDGKILIRTLGLEESGLQEFPTLREVVFPPVLEDPFTSEDKEGSYFAITYRMIDMNGTSFIAKARLYMSANPFKDRQFAFAPALD